MIRHRLQLPLCTLSLALLATVAFAQSTTAPAKDAKPAADAKTADGAKWIALPTTADGPWESCNFGGDGEIEYKDGVAHLGFGDPLTGIRLKKEDFPKENFEIELQARRTSGFDFFCGLTFPVGEGNVSFVLGGWSGGVVGISSIDDQDASENETTDFKTFKNGTWFTVRARVDEKKIQCWIDDKQFVDVQRGDHKFSIRNEMDPSLPVGVAAFQVTSEIRNVRWRKLSAKDKTAEDKTETEDTATGGNDS
ncbi:3-keto-disaccharide hydrolase [Roseimaritima ulvae]|uniref:3-keto-alpha-glucoside-1,2-lyase/3-keto-2-hydroxy-glucal hydratase domain-containing protein n=1 Tax=Roseimaritima ulvae TaxID=980254 RepID=A0A5B9QVG5_9BACT|nr:DUF1080 domain-containing protein [Roseimaritima ulvae]QEG41942.1 hypothetical protein UC8_39700 [Roseimaritima ulvae]